MTSRITWNSRRHVELMMERVAVFFDTGSQSVPASTCKLPRLCGRVDGQGCDVIKRHKFSKFCESLDDAMTDKKYKPLSSIINLNRIKSRI